MKTQILLLLHIIFLLLCACSCHDTPYPKSLQIADSIVSTAPDSAIVLLEQLKDSMLSKPQSIQMYYHLLSIKAKDKAYIPHTSDSLILQIIHYYENKKDKKHLSEAYYYAGRIYRDLGDAPQALDYFQKAIDATDKDTGYKLLSGLYSQMGTLCLYEDIYDKANNAYKKAFYYDVLLKDSVAIVFDLRDIGDTFTGYSKTDSALYYYERAQALAKKMNNQSLIEMTQIGLASLYKQLKKYDLAQKELQSFSNDSILMHLRKERRNAVYAIIAELYYQKQDLDSATYYFNLLLEPKSSIYSKQAAHWGLAAIAQKQKNYQSALEQINNFIIDTDSIRKITNTKTIRKMHSLYNYQLRENENHQLRIKNTQQKLWITTTICIIIILVAFTITYIQYSKRKKLQLREKLNKLKALKKQQYQKSMQFIEENNARIQILEEQLQSTTEKNTALLNLLQIQKQQTMLMNYKATTDQKEQELAEIAFKQSDIYNLFHNAINNTSLKLTQEDWTTLQLHVDRCYKDFTHRLRALYPISDMEMQICLLLKIDITTTGIAILTTRSKSAIVSARKKLYEKVHGEKGKPEQWDAFIASL